MLDSGERAPAGAPGREETGADGARAEVAHCPHYHQAVELVGKRWNGVILRALLAGPMRFHQLARAVPELSDRLLSQRLKELEARGLISRHVDPGPPVRVTYALTEMGAALRPALDALHAWARRWLAR
jgi:DNA-binding HxlR family transcriptional regulator